MAYQLKDVNDQPVKYHGQDVFAHDQTGSVKAVNKGNRTLVIVGTDETKDRDGDIITVKGWKIDNFLKNPVFLYAHNYSSVPIGSATKLIKKKDPARLEFHEKFPSEGLYPFADMIFELFNEKILNASSVGFIAIEHEPLEKDSNSDEMFSRGRRYLKQELLELSACPVPSNPNALQNSIKFMKSHTADEITQMMSGQMELNMKKDEVLGELNVKEIEFVDENEIKSFVPQNYTIEKEEEFITIKGEFEEVEKGVSSLPLADKVIAWDGNVARVNMAKSSSSDGSGNKDKMNWGKYGKGFAFIDAANKNDFGGYKLPFADVFSGSLKAVYKGVIAAMAAINGARGGMDLGSDYDKVYSFLAGYYKRFGETPPPKKSIEEEIDEMKKEIENIEEKSGAVLNAVNKKRLSDALSLIQAVVTESEKSVNEEDDTEKEVTISDVMDQIDIIASDIDGIKEYIEQTQSKDNGDEDIVKEKDSLQDEYAKVLSQDDNKDQEEKADGLSPEDEEVIKQVIANLKNLNK